MRLDVEISHDTGRKMPRALHLRGRRVAVTDVVDQWFGDDYRYCKVSGDDGAVYILRVTEHSADWQLVLFVSARLQATSALSGT